MFELELLKLQYNTRIRVLLQSLFVCQRSMFLSIRILMFNFTYTLGIFFDKRIFFF